MSTGRLINDMIYKDFHGLRISLLAMGAMRLPTINGNEADIDEEQTSAMVDYAMAKGINYYDTAWGYHSGNSETVMGRALSKYPRESFYLATKFPGYDLSNMNKAQQIFEKQLEKCGTDYFDFYMFHNVCEMNIDAYLDPKYGIFDYLTKQMDTGRIRHLGFSAHGDTGVIQRFLEAYGYAMEFCQIQANYLDWKFQDARAKIEMLNERGIPVLIMEPLRGGQLVNLSDEAVDKLRALRPDESMSAWAFRFVQSLPGVVTVLSGMSNLEQLKDNIKIFESEKPLNVQETQALLDIAEDIVKRTAVPCTACRYCIDSCPQELDIPRLLRLYNEYCVTGGGFIAPMALMAISPEKQPSSCIHCRSCEAVCPQQIKISKALSDFAKRLNSV